MVGATLDHFEIVAPLGAGGMGEVYRAQDTQLGREVAIKVLPASLAHDPDRLARFEREARMLATFSHPNIAQVHGFQEAELDGPGSKKIRFLVMELAEGEDLARRLERGPLPESEARAISLQIAEALEAAHARGVVHRDLKPANVHVSAEVSGAPQVKVLDFGLAKALVPSGPDHDLSSSPTLTQPTVAGALMGTASYMSPEQARGHEADQRSDIWAFGCVLYEMLTGSKAFPGESVSEVLAAVLKDEPNLEPLDQASAGALSYVVTRCLEKDPRERFQHIGDVRYELRSDGSMAGGGLRRSPVRGSRAARWRRWAFVSAAGAIVALLLWQWRPGTSPPASASADTWTTANLTIPGDVRTVAFSPDGRQLLYGLEASDEPLRIRDMQSGETTVLPGTERGDVGLHPSFSPSGEEVYFVDSRNRLSSMNLETGGVSLHEEDVRWGFEGGDGHLYYVVDPSGPEAVSLFRRPLEGGPVRNFGHFYTLPSRQPLDGIRLGWTTDGRGLSVLDLASGSTQTLLEPPSWSPKYLGDGYFVFFSNVEGSLQVARIDSSAGTLVEEPRIVARDVDTTIYAMPVYDVSATGDLVYRQSASKAAEIVWVGRRGEFLGVAASEEANYEGPRMSPKGRSLAIGDGRVRKDLDLERGSWTEVAGGHTVLWLSETETLVLQEEGVGSTGIYLDSPDGAQRRRLGFSDAGRYENVLGATPDGRFVFYNVFPQYLLHVYDRETQQSVTLVEGARIVHAAVHPEGRFVAYSGRGPDQGIWVLPLPDLASVVAGSAASGRPRRLTTGDHTEVLWSPDGNELFFRGSTHVMAIEVDTSGSKVGHERPTELFEDDYKHHSLRGWLNWGVHPDGRFLFLRPVESGREGNFVYVQNWVSKVRAEFEGN